MKNISSNNLKQKPSILVVDDEPDIRHLVQEILQDEDYIVEVAEDGASARIAYEKHAPDLILLDIWMPDIDGISLLKEWTSHDDFIIPVIMMSGHGTVETAVEATRLGAFDFIEKPLSLAKLLSTVEQALHTNDTSSETKLHANHSVIVNEPIGHSPAIQQLREQIKRIAEFDSWVYMRGEAGSGASVAAHYLHNHSSRKNKKFVEINCATLNYDESPEDFVGSTSKPGSGLLNQAHGGTLFLRNIDMANKSTQNFLLSLLQSNFFHQDNNQVMVPFNARIICSSYSRDGAPSIQEFRQDLFYMLNVVPLSIPALREHREDIPDLLHFYTDYFVGKKNLPYRHFSLPAQNRLRNYDWSGNILELTRLVQHLLITAQGNEITLEEVEANIQEKPKISLQEEGNPNAYELPLREAREQFEREYLIHQLKTVDGSVGKTAKLIGMERTHLYRKLRSLNIDPKTL
ncbi:MAG: sigma-54 dependent transcriptional regulator [Woeseiaceae bacterium]